MTTAISIVMPVRNEAELIATALGDILALPPSPAARITEVLVVDGDSQDNTAARARAAADEFGSDARRRPPDEPSENPGGRNEAALVRVLQCRPGRARQMNEGGLHASGDLLLFLHADCSLPAAACRALGEACRQGAEAGSFRHEIDDPHWLYRVVEWGDGFRQRWLRMPYGDQALFVRRRLFQQLGGFPDVPLMEDVRLVRQLRRRTRLHVIEEPLQTNARRWRRRGVVRQFLLNQTLLLAEQAGVPLERLAKIYYG